jgi:hypothetical protein
LKGLSCLKGNFHEQFLGGLAGAIPPGYPAGDSDIISLPNHIPDLTPVSASMENSSILYATKNDRGRSRLREFVQKLNDIRRTFKRHILLDPIQDISRFFILHSIS